MFKSKARREAERQLKVQQEKEKILTEQQIKETRKQQQQEKAEAQLKAIGLWYGNLSRANKVIVAVGGFILIAALGRSCSVPQVSTTALDEPTVTPSEVAPAPVVEESS